MSDDIVGRELFLRSVRFRAALAGPCSNGTVAPTDIGVNMATVGAEGQPPLPAVGMYKLTDDGNAQLFLIMLDDEAEEFAREMLRKVKLVRRAMGKKK